MNLHLPERLPRLPGILSPYRLFVRPLLFLLDAESAHELTTRICRLLWSFKWGRDLTRAIYARNLPRIPARIPANGAALELANPVGLAAGFDKNGLLIPGIEALGFGFVEIGTVTPRPQLGNPQPRIARETAQRAIVNRMGFPNDGADIMAARLKKVKEKVAVPVGINISKNRDTPNSEAVKDYETLLKRFRDIADYFAINISSPNTPGLRELQSNEFLQALYMRIESLRLTQSVFLKLSPDLPHARLKDVCALCGTGKPFTGLILTNTEPSDLGGISGYPLRKTSLQMLMKAREMLPAGAPVISVGGIETAADARERLAAGATAVQIYTTLIYQGPSAVRRIVRGLRAR
ncbi:MAG: quinone-dependent dihydroorotate dehydrogenase [Deltaproteobacteria bacterium]|nr:quinone-dependent dihydroorotate dehydrogenase [Deltaproteobacteria bacterium]